MSTKNQAFEKVMELTSKPGPLTEEENTQLIAATILASSNCDESEDWAFHLISAVTLLGIFGAIAVVAVRLFGG